MNKIFFSALAGALLCPTLIFAAVCSSNGTTIVYVNGIETTQQEAENDMKLLGHVFTQYGGSPGIQFINGYNPSHLDGLGDEIESASQAFNAPISDFDLDTILNQIASEVTTQKVLLVGHSQGSFYANELYDYLVHNGVSPQSIAAYDIANPAGSVGGGGAYLTSSNDKVINYVRKLDAQWNAPKSLPANIVIALEPGYADNAWGGHAAKVYFEGAPQRIASDIQSALAKLSAGPDMQRSCFAPPELDAAYNAQKFMLGIADPTVASLEFAADDTRNTLISVMKNTNDIVNTAVGDAIFSIIPRPTAQNAAGAFAVEKALYGSSLSVADYEALLNGEDIPEVRPTPEPSQDSSKGESKSAESQPKPEAQPKQNPPAQIQLAHKQQDLNPVQIAPPAAPAVPPAPAAIPIPTPLPITGSPGFGGGGAAPAPAIESAAQTASPGSGPDQNPQESQSGDDATSSDESSSESETPTPSSDATASSSEETASTTPENPDSPGQGETLPMYGQSPVADNFDSDDLSAWTFLSKTLFRFDTSTTDCLLGSCIVNDTYDSLPAMYRIGTPLASGTAILYFKDQGYTAQVDFGICQDSGCKDPNQWVGVHSTPSPVYAVDSWNYWFVAWRQGTTDEELCTMTDDSDSSDCTWRDSKLPKGVYDGIFVAQNSGMSRGSALYFDELGVEPVRAAGGVQ